MKRLMFAVLLPLSACSDEAPRTDPAVTRALEQLSAKIDQLQRDREPPADPAALPESEVFLVSNQDPQGSSCWVLKKEPNGDLHLATYRVQGGGVVYCTGVRRITYDLMLADSQGRGSWDKSRKEVLSAMESRPSKPDRVRDGLTSAVAEAGTNAVHIWLASGNHVRIPLERTPRELHWAEDGLRAVMDDGTVHLVKRQTWEHAGKIE